MGLHRHHIALLRFISKWVDKQKKQNKQHIVNLQTFTRILPFLQEEETKFRGKTANDLHKIWEQNLKNNHPAEHQKARNGKYHRDGVTRRQSNKAGKKSGVVYEEALKKKKFVKLELEIYDKCRDIYMRNHEDTEPKPSKSIKKIMHKYLDYHSSDSEETSDSTESDGESSSYSSSNGTPPPAAGASSRAIRKRAKVVHFK
ncbi:hypothetical protein Ddc_20027 [Ditylenchus destructor]|nr:hypothetical protein Ddc_20027 [Ditylenchus destructor]